MKRASLFFFFCWLALDAASQFHTSIDFVSSVDHTEFKGLVYIGPGDIFSTQEIDSKINYRVGANFNFRCYDQFMIKTGLRFVKLGFKENIDINAMNGGSILQLPFPFDPFIQIYEYNSFDQQLLEIPLIGRYEFGERKFALFVEAGISPHLKIASTNTKIKRISLETIVEDIQFNGDNRVLVGYVIGLGFNYKVGDNYQFFAQSTHRSFAKTKNEFGFEHRMMSLGLEFGIRRGLRFSTK